MNPLRHLALEYAKEKVGLPDEYTQAYHEIADAVMYGLRLGMQEAVKHCLCTRDTFGFDYREPHAKLGPPRLGSRWLTPTDLFEALEKLK
jgi:hypothetical protein